jgi:hypothetical protein
MKQNFFYSHLIEIADISIQLKGMELTEDEKNHLIALLEANIHSTIINTVLSELTDDDKKQFLKNLVSDNHQVTLDHLKIKIEKLEDKIKTSVADLKKELLEDLETANKLTQE